MDKYFPKAERISLAPGIETLLFKLNDLSGTQIGISKLAPGTVLDMHSHPEIQFGMALQGQFTMQVESEKRLLTPFETAYVVEENQTHGARNDSAEEAVGLDLKFAHIERCPIAKAQRGSFLTLTHHQTLKTGIRMAFFVSPWFEVMLSYIPPQATMPVHAHKNEQFGIAVKGDYIVEVGNESQSFTFGKVYYSPANVPHGAYNPFDEEAISLNIFVPPRYNLIPKRDRALISLVEDVS